MAILGAGGLFKSLTGGGAAEAAADEQFPVSKPPAEWRQQLTPEQYYVLREHGTERAGTSQLNSEKRSGTFVCAGCGRTCSLPAPNLRAGPDGRASGSRWRAPSESRKTARSS
jgi:hypothetical protein